MHKKSKHNSRIIFVTIVLIAVSFYSLVAVNTSLPFSNILKDIVSNIEYYVIKAPIGYVSGVFDEYNQLKNVYEENVKLKESLDNYARELSMNDVLANELEDLKEITGIDSLTTDFKVKYTTVIARDSENWSNNVTINLGSVSGVKTGMAVITSKGMIGTVSEVNEISSTVSLLSSEKSSTQLSVMVLSGENTYYALLDNYNIKDKSYKITFLSTIDTLEDNATVVTSGLGGPGKSPKGILIGNVQPDSLKTDAMSNTCVVTPSVDFDSLNYVAVVQRVD